MSELTELIDQQLAAYNRRDIDRFVGCYAAEARIVQPDGSYLAEGHLEIRARYGELFEQSPDLHAQIRTRITAGSFVIDEEIVTGLQLAGMPSELHAAVAYRVAEGVIQEAHLYG
jgi:hypothetical protein